MYSPTGGVALSMIASQERGSFYLFSCLYYRMIPCPVKDQKLIISAL